MPELPEVETIACSLKEKLVSRSFVSIELFRHDILRQDRDTLLKRIKGQKIIRVFRRGKYIFFEFENEENLITHLRMTGKYVFANQEHAPQKHDRVSFRLDSGETLLYNDVRCFGTIEVAHKNDLPRSILSLGFEPFDQRFTEETLSILVKKSQQTTKNFLMDQSKIAGLGNIYVSEILHASNINPRRSIQLLSKRKIEKLYTAIRSILQEAILKNGTTISDYRRVDEKTGEFQDFLKVYGKVGQPCEKCGTMIRKISQNQRSTFFCPSCQKS